MGDQRGLPKKSNYFGGLGGLVGQDGQGDGGGHMVRVVGNVRMVGVVGVVSMVGLIKMVGVVRGYLGWSG